jgi:hypothetical protein
MPKQIVGSVYWIENGKQTDRVVDAKEAFTDLDQAKAQVLSAEASGNKKWIKLVRLAFQQFQGMRYRGENKAKLKRTTEADQERIPKPPKEEPTKVKSSKKPTGRKVERKAVAVASKSSRSEISNTKAAKKAARRGVARKAASKVASKSSAKRPSIEKASKKAARRRMVRKAATNASKSLRSRPSKVKSSKKTARRVVARKGSVRKAVKNAKEK